MAITRLNVSGGAVRTGCGGEDPVAEIERSLRRLPETAPIVILLHGFRYNPFDQRPGRPADPHNLIYAAEQPADQDPRRSWLASWPTGLDCSGPGAGLCIPVGWRAAPDNPGGTRRYQRRAFVQAREEAAATGRALAPIVQAITTIRPAARIDILAHSLGARAALVLLDSLARIGEAQRIGRMILLGAAVKLAEADDILSRLAPRLDGPEVYNVISRENDVYDALFELACPGGPTAAIGRSGLFTRRRDWFDLQIDSRRMQTWLGARGVHLAGDPRVACHWGFYTRPGAMSLYNSIIRDRTPWSIAEMRRCGAPEQLDPRWSTLSARRLPNPFRLGGLRGAQTPTAA